jgi:hypothetical protein
MSTGMMWAMHTWMILTNKTTIENGVLMQHGNPFSKGIRNNWRATFGSNTSIIWVLLPVRASLGQTELV